MNVLLTRPLAQVKPLEALVANQGWKPLLFPTLEIVALQTKVEHMHYDAVIFISANAVDHGLELLNALDYSAVYAVGAATAKRLTDQAITVDGFPLEKASSEALLALESVAKLRHKNILIFRGKGGRETLRLGLEKNHNQVEYAQVYDRVVCDKTSAHEQALTTFLANDQGVISVTSNENLDGLIALAGQLNQLEKITVYPLIVLSQRIRQHALSRGFLQVLVTDDIGDQAIIDVLATIDTLDKQS